MIKNNKLTLEQRVTRLENILGSRTKSRKFEGGPVNDTLIAQARALKAMLKHRGVYEPEVTIDGAMLVVTLEWEYFGTGEFFVLQTAKGYMVEFDGMREYLPNLDRVADYISDRDSEAAADL